MRHGLWADLLTTATRLFCFLESIVENKGFVLDDFFQRWVPFMRGYDGYMDAATRQTLERVEFGEGPESSGSNSHDLAGASRLGPLIACYGDDEEALVAAAKAQTRMTHNNAKVLAAAEFFARVVSRELRGQAPVAAMREAAALDYGIPDVADWVESGLALGRRRQAWRRSPNSAPPAMWMKPSRPRCS